MFNFTWKQTAVGILAASVLLMQVPPAMANVVPATPIIVQASTYAISEQVNAQVKNAYVEKTQDGWRMGTVIKLSNTSGLAIRIPDYELRAKGADSTIYTLQPSAANVKSIPAYGEIELSYMAEVKTKHSVEITDLAWVYVDWNVYPKTETVLAEATIRSQVWNGSDAVLTKESLLRWGESFQVPHSSASLQYSSVNVTTQYNGQSPTYTLQLKVENIGAYTETVPDFTISAKTLAASYAGKRLEQTVTLNPQESAYLHYVISAQPDEQLEAFYVLTPETFVKQAGAMPTQYWVGGLGFGLPEAGTTDASLAAYQLGSPIAIDPLSHAVHPQVGVSVVNLDWFTNEGQSFRTAVAKIKYTNNSSSTIPLPALGADLTNSRGEMYTGNRVALPVTSLPPGMSAVQQVTFMIPSSDDTDQFTLRLLESSGQNGYHSPIAKLHVGIRTSEPSQKQLDMYPYQLDLQGWSLSMLSIQNAATRQYNYTYKVNADLDIQTLDGVVTDPVNPKLFMQLTNPSGERVGYKSFTLTGDNRLVSGSQTMYFDNVSIDQLQGPLTLEIYESISTPAGEAKRLLAALKQ